MVWMFFLDAALHTTIAGYVFYTADGELCVSVLNGATETDGSLLIGHMCGIIAISGCRANPVVILR